MTPSSTAAVPPGESESSGEAAGTLCFAVKC